MNGAMIADGHDGPLLQLSGIWRSYERGTETVVALSGVDLWVNPGEAVALIGRSGSGKSTLLHIAGGLDLADRGTVRVTGRDPAAMSVSQRAELRRHAVGFVFQFFHLLPQLTVVENVELPLLLNGGRKSRSRARDVLASVGLAEKAGRYPTELSGGEMQRVALARALVGGAPLILADEPTGNLDSVTGGEVLDLLIAQVAERDAALLLVTHDAQAAGRADRVLTLVDGKIASASR